MTIEANVKMGFEGLIYYGAPGSTASTLLENTQDISYNIDTEKGETTVRGDSTSVPVGTQDTTKLNAQIEWTMIDDITDAAFEALNVAAFSGAAVAIRTKAYSTGKGFDGDCILTAQEGMPIAGAQTTQFTAVPTRSYGRAPQLRV